MAKASLLRKEQKQHLRGEVGPDNGGPWSDEAWRVSRQAFHIFILGGNEFTILEVA